MRGNKVCSVVLLFIAVLTFVTGFFAAGISEPINAAANVVVLPANKPVIKDNMKMRIDRSTFSGISGAGSILSLNKTARSDAYVLRIKHPKAERTKAKTFENVGVLKFVNVGKINGRSIDAEITLTVYIGKRKENVSNENDTYVQIGTIKDYSMTFGGTYAKNITYPFRGLKYITAKVNMKYHDSGQTVNLPFYQLVSDIDMPGKDGTSRWYRESWKPTGGFTTYYVYSGNVLEIDKSVPIFMSDSDGPDYQDGTEQIKKAGVYGVTSGGIFSSQYREANNVSAGFKVFCQYQPPPGGVLGRPEKYVNSEREISAKSGDEITYTVAFDGPCFMKNLISPLGELKFTDTLAEGLTFKSASLTAGGVNLVKAGNALVSYNEETRKVTGQIHSSWLTNLNNYKGQRFVLTITAEINENSGELSEIENTGYVNIGIGDVPSNSTTVKVTPSYSVRYEYRSGTEGMELPEDISVHKGDYSISDSKKYTEGQEIINKSREKPETYEGSVYVVQDEEGGIAGRWILSWDRESTQCTGEDITFTGTWTYVDAKKFKVHYSYISSDERRLPPQISTKQGDYAVSDPELYTEGQEVKRKTNPGIGSTYEVRNKKGSYMGKWVLKQWDKDSETVVDTDIRFTGTWEYEAAPKLRIVKRIKNDVQNITPVHGEPTFAYKIETDGSIRYEALTFDVNSIDSVREKGKYTDLESGVIYEISDGYMNAEKTISMEPGKYTVAELETERYRNRSVKVYVKDSGTVPETYETDTVEINLTEGTAVAEFTNYKINNEGLSHSNCVINRLNSGIEIPEGGYYTSSDNDSYIEGDRFPEPEEGDVFEYGEYIYTYHSAGDYDYAGWYVKAAKTSKKHYGEILDKIGKTPVVSMDGCFDGCSEMIDSPYIPESILSINGAFRNCVNLESAPVIPKNTADIEEAFAGCASLSGKVTVNGEPENFENCFLNTVLTIKLCHKFDEDLCENVIKTANNKNVFCSMIPEGGVYYDSSEKVRLTDGDEFPDSPGTGDIYRLGDYEYRYGMNREGGLKGKEITWEENNSDTWFVSVSEPLKESYGEMLSLICADPVEGVINTFRDNVNLAEAPVISSNASTMSHAFDGCTSLRKGPEIPGSVTDLSYAFYGCVNLEKAFDFK